MGSNIVAVSSYWRVFNKGEEPSNEWHKNMVLDTGLIDWLYDQRGLEYSSVSSDMQFTHIAVGSGNYTVPTKADVSLENELHKYAIDQEYSAAVNTDDPLNPYIILGAEIPSGTELLLIAEAGLCTSGVAPERFFNRHVFVNGLGIPAALIKLPEDVVIVQCKIVMSNSCELISENVEMTDPNDGTYSQTRTVNNIMLIDGIKRLFSKDFARDTKWSGTLGTNASTPTNLDIGVNTPLSANYTCDATIRHPEITSYGAKLSLSVSFISTNGPSGLHGLSINEFAIIGGGIDMHASWTPAFVMEGYMVCDLYVYIDVEFIR